MTEAKGMVRIDRDDYGVVGNYELELHVFGRGEMFTSELTQIQLRLVPKFERALKDELERFMQGRDKKNGKEQND